MGRYVIRRLFGVALTLLIISIATFGIFFAGPGPDAVARLTCGKQCPPEAYQAIRTKMELDKPLYQQYGNYMKGIFVGREIGSGPEKRDCPAPCLGYSFKTDQPVATMIAAALPITVSIALGASIMWLFFGVLLGIIAALRRGKWQDRGAAVISLAGVSAPVFFIGYLLIFIFSAKLGWFPFPSWVPFSDNPLGWAQNLLLPWVTLAFAYAALYTRITRATMLESMSEDYIRTARAKGLSERRVVTKHGLRSALTPIITIFGLDLGGLLGGAIITEQVFGLPGLGKLSLNSVFDFDLPVIVGVTLLAAFFIVMANLIVDILYAFIDPKVRLS